MTDAVHPNRAPLQTGDAPRPLRAASASRRPLILAICALVAATLLVLFFTTWLPAYRANWGVVVPGKIYRSAEMSPAYARNKLEQNHINVIIFLSHDDEGDGNIAAERQIAAEKHIQFLDFPMKGDGVAPPEMYTQALLALVDATRNGKSVLVHCHSGAQRTGGVVAVYRMLVEHKTPDQALAEMKHYGHDPRKNLTLVPFLNEHIGEWADALAKAGVIDRAPDPLPKLIP